MTASFSKPHLTRQDWLVAGLNALTADGAGALKVEPLARILGATKGSFYWHFRDLPDYHRAMLSHWEAHALGKLPDESKAETKPAMRLRALAQQAARRDDANPAGDPMVRAWSRNFEEAAEAVARVDAKRLARLSELLTDCGVTNPELARAIYAAIIGLEDISTRDGQSNDTAIGTLIDLVLALR